MKTQYDEQASQFISSFGLKLRMTLSDSKTAPWGDDEYHPHYRVTLSRASGWNAKKLFVHCSGRLTFDFFGSINDGKNGTHPSEYDVLACISSDIHTPDTFEDFCAEYGESEDSRKALQTFRRADRFARRLRMFFTSEEIEALAEIQ